MALFDIFGGGNPTTDFTDAPSEADRKRALNMALMQAGAAILANNRGNYGALAPALGAGIQNGLLSYNYNYEKGQQAAAKRKLMEMQKKLFSESMIPASPGSAGTPATSAQYKVGDMPFSSPQEAEQYITKQGGGGTRNMFQNDFSQLPQQTPLYLDPKMQVNAIPGTPGNPAVAPSPGGFNTQKFLMGALQNPEAGFANEALSALLKGGDAEEYGTTPFVDAQGNVVQLGKRGSVRQTGLKGAPKDGKLGTIDIPLSNGSWQMFQENPDGTPNFDKPIGSSFRKRATASEQNIGGISLSTEKKYGEQFAGKVAESDITLRDAAMKAPDLAERSNRIKQVLESGNVITGFGADARLQFGKAMGLVGASDKETIANTEALSADLARNTLDAIKASGLGSGNGFSNADRDFLNKAAGGLISFDAATLKRLANLSYRTAEQSALKWGKRASEIPKSAIEGTGIDTSPVEIPPLRGSQESFKLLPNAVKYSGRTITDQQTKKKYRSDGTKWVEVK